MTEDKGRSGRKGKAAELAEGAVEVDTGAALAGWAALLIVLVAELSGPLS